MNYGTTTTIENHKSGRNMRVRTNNLRFALLGTLFSTLQISFQHDQFTSNLTVQQATKKENTRNVNIYWVGLLMFH